MTDEQLENLLSGLNSNKRLPTEYEILEKQKQKKKFRRTCKQCGHVCLSNHNYITYHSKNCTKNLQQTENNCTTSD